MSSRTSNVSPRGVKAAAAWTPPVVRDRHHPGARCGMSVCRSPVVMTLLWIGHAHGVAGLVYSDVHEALREAVPEFGPVIDEHIAYYEGPVQHVLFGDLTRFVLGARQRGDHLLVERCLGFLDVALRDGDDEVQNLVAVSFVENVELWDDDVRDFIRSWPTALLAEAERQRGWQPGSG